MGIRSLTSLETFLSLDMEVKSYVTLQNCTWIHVIGEFKDSFCSVNKPMVKMTIFRK